RARRTGAGPRHHRFPYGRTSRARERFPDRAACRCARAPAAGHCRDGAGSSQVRPSARRGGGVARVPRVAVPRPSCRLQKILPNRTLVLFWAVSEDSMALSRRAAPPAGLARATIRGARVTASTTSRRSPSELSPGYAANMQGVAAVDRALSILVAIEAAEDGSMSLAELAAATLLYKSTLLRLLVSLERGALVVRRADQRYALGPFAFRLGKSFEAHNPIERSLAPIMRELVEKGTESPSFHIRHDETRRLCLMRLDSRHSTLDRVRAGDLLPIDRGAAGRILLAFGELGAATPPEVPRTMV